MECGSEELMGADHDADRWVNAVNPYGGESSSRRISVISMGLLDLWEIDLFFWPDT